MCDYCENIHRLEEHDCMRCGARFCLDDGTLRYLSSGESDWLCHDCIEEEDAEPDLYPISPIPKTSARKEPPEMYLCKYCGQHHPIGSKEWICPLAPKGV